MTPSKRRPSKPRSASASRVAPSGGQPNRSDGETLTPQPHLHFDDSKMWKLEHVRGHTLASPLMHFRSLTPEQREAATAEYRKGFTINAVN